MALSAALVGDLVTDDVRYIYIYMYMLRYTTILRYQTKFLIEDHVRFKLPNFCDNFV